MDVFEKILCKDVVKLEPQYIDKNYKSHVLTKLKKKVEGVCSKHGFIKEDSIIIHKVAPGLVELSTLSGNVLYDVVFYADVCNPLLGSIIQAQVTNSNRFGILAEAESVLEIVIAKNSVNIQSEIDLESIKIGDVLKVEILGKKYELGDKKICAIGRAVNSNKFKDLLIGDNGNEPEEEDEEDDAVVEDEEEEEEEEEEDGDEEEEDEDDDEVEVKIGGEAASDFFSEEEESIFSEEEEGGDSEGGGDASDNDAPESI